jgi:hypothetical protein
MIVWNYIIGHWRGRLGLIKSSLINGIGGFSLLCIVSLIVDHGFGFIPYTMIGLFLVWSIWACVGIFRCGARYAADNSKSIIVRGTGIISMSVIVVIAWFLAKDFYHLMGIPLIRYVAGRA